MISVIVTYTVRPDRVDENVRLVRAVYEGLREINDPDIHYGTFRKPDGRTFVHVAFFPSPEKQALLSASPAFQEFQAGLLDRCEIPPQVEPVTRIGSYRLSHPAEERDEAGVTERTATTTVD